MDIEKLSNIVHSTYATNIILQDAYLQIIGISTIPNNKDDDGAAINDTIAIGFSKIEWDSQGVDHYHDPSNTRSDDLSDYLLSWDRVRREIRPFSRFD